MHDWPGDPEQDGAGGQVQTWFSVCCQSFESGGELDLAGHQKKDAYSLWVDRPERLLLNRKGSNWTLMHNEGTSSQMLSLLSLVGNQCVGGSQNQTLLKAEL